MTVRTRSTPLSVTHLALILALAGCGGGEESVGEPVRLESREVGIALEVPASASFSAAGTEGGVVRLTSPGETTESGERLGPATLVYDAEPPQVAGVNLVEAVNLRAEEIRSRPEGEFYGQGELGSPLGAAYSTRGRFRDADGEVVEELRIVAVHPGGDRLLHMTLAYTPAPGQTAARLEQALSAFSWIEPLDSPGSPAEEDAAGEAADPAPPEAP